MTKMKDHKIRELLLEDLTNAEWDKFAEDCFADEILFTQVQQVEEDLIIDYLQDGLTSAEKELFHTHYLTTQQRRENVAFTAALLKHANPRQPNTFANVAPPKTWRERWRKFINSWRWSWATAGSLAALAILILSWAVFIRPRQAPAGNSLALNSNARPNTNRAFLLLEAPLVTTLRGAPEAALPRVELPLAEEFLRLKLTLPAGTPQSSAFIVEINKPDGTKDEKSVAVQEQRLLLDLRAADLQPGRYALSIFSVAPDGATERLFPQQYVFLVTNH